MHPILFSIGRFEVPSYGVLSMVGIVAGALVLGLLVGRRGGDRSDATWAALEAILVGLLAAKIVGIAFQPGLGEVPFLQLVVHSAGVWYVGFLAGVGYATWRFRRFGLPLLDALDCAAPAVATGHCFGRIACFLAGCCWGGRCDAPWAVTFTSERAHQMVHVPLGVPLHPVQLYEAGIEALTALGLSILVWKRWYRFRLQPGLTYLVVYGTWRFFVEFLRDDPRGGAGLLSTSQVIALSVLAIAAPLYVLGLVRGTIAPWGPKIPGGDAKLPPRAGTPAA
jgi:phosphatidylglycerol:prolipoprotein diacylglycerol transferase